MLATLNLPKNQDKLELKADDLAFWFWIALGVKQFIIALLFPDNPAMGTLTSALITFAFALLLTVALLVREGASVRIFTRPVLPLAAFLVWSGASILWTQADSRFVAFGFWAVSAIEAAIMLVLFQLEKPDRVAIKSLQGLVVGAALYALVALTIGRGGESVRLGNDGLLQTNFIANQMAIASLCTIHLLTQLRSTLENRLIWIGILCLLLFTMLQALSKTSMLGFVCALFLYLSHNRGRSKKNVFILAMVLGLFALSYGAISSYLTQYLTETQGGEALATLSGRTIIWAEFVQMSLANPILGYGFYSIRDAGPAIAVALGHATAHNEWLTVWFSLGLVGVALTIHLYISFLRRGLEAKRNGKTKPQAVLALALLLFVFIRGFTEGSAIGLIFPFPLMALLLGWMKHEE